MKNIVSNESCLKCDNVKMHIIIIMIIILLLLLVLLHYLLLLLSIKLNLWLPRESNWLTKLLQLTGSWRYDGIM